MNGGERGVGGEGSIMPVADASLTGSRFTQRHEAAARRSQVSDLKAEAIALEKQGKPDMAEVRVRQVLEVDPQDAFAWHHLIRLLNKQGKRSEALEAYRVVLAPHPKWGSNLEDDPLVLAKYLELGLAFKSQADVDAAVDRILAQGRKTSGSGPKVPATASDASHRMSNACVIVGLHHASRGQYEEAKQSYSSALEEWPQSPYALYYLGWEMEKQGYTKLAMDLYMKARTGFSDQPEDRAAVERKVERLRLPERFERAR